MFTGQEERLSERFRSRREDECGQVLGAEVPTRCPAWYVPPLSLLQSQSISARVGCLCYLHRPLSMMIMAMMMLNDDADDV